MTDPTIPVPISGPWEFHRSIRQHFGQWVPGWVATSLDTTALAHIERRAQDAPVKAPPYVGLYDALGVTTRDKFRPGQTDWDGSREADFTVAYVPTITAWAETHREALEAEPTDADGR